MKIFSILWGVIIFLFSLLMFITWVTSLHKLLLEQYGTYHNTYDIKYILGYIFGELIWLYVTYLLFRYSIRKIRGN